MSKKAEQNRLIHQGTNVALEQTSIYEDNLLPPAEELGRMKQVSEDLIPFVMEETRKEHEERRAFNQKRLAIMADEIKKSHQTNLLLIVITFIMFVLFVGLSALFLYLGYDISGSIFGCTAGVLVVIYITRLRISNPSNNMQ